MTAAEWDACTDPDEMQRLVETRGRASDRKKRLLTVAYCRCVWHLLKAGRGRDAVETAERAADRLATGAEMAEALLVAEAALRESSVQWKGKSAFQASLMARDAATPGAAVVPNRVPLDRRRVRVALLRCIFGNPFRQPPLLSQSVLAWEDGTVRRLAEEVSANRALPSGELDRNRLAVLADALEDAGCSDAELLMHLRGPGPHYRGCFAVDAVLGHK